VSNTFVHTPNTYFTADCFQCKSFIISYFACDLVGFLCGELIFHVVRYAVKVIASFFRSIIEVQYKHRLQNEMGLIMLVSILLDRPVLFSAKILAKSDDI